MFRITVIPDPHVFKPSKNKETIFLNVNLHEYRQPIFYMKAVRCSQTDVGVGNGYRGLVIQLSTFNC